MLREKDEEIKQLRQAAALAALPAPVQQLRQQPSFLANLPPELGAFRSASARMASTASNEEEVMFAGTLHKKSRGRSMLGSMVSSK